jgi:GNAT superfamily N-acetyltransferase
MMCDEWMPALELALNRTEFRQLPRNAAYKYEYLEGRAYLLPRPRFYHALLRLAPPAGPAACPGGVALRPAGLADFTGLVPQFAAAFSYIQPFGSLDDATRLTAAGRALQRTLTGGDGPWIEGASFVATAGERADAVGGVFVTLLPDGDPCEWSSYYWSEPPPADCVERRLGRPHLTWIFTTPSHSGQGIGTALLAAAASALAALGFSELVSTFLAGNDSSMLWHWRNGFELLTHPASRRRRKS